MNSIIGFKVNSNCLKNREPFKLGVGHNNFKFISLLNKESLLHSCAFIYLDVMKEESVALDPYQDSERNFIFLQCCTNVKDYVDNFGYKYLSSIVIDNEDYHLFELYNMYVYKGLDEDGDPIIVPLNSSSKVD